ncbi:hypothetical protein RRG08_049623 [Elysia crispata]|uniref:Uncharacterized protein n=1 Tax=Elysia crispata TaxID=231223 RepID=A0AAE1AUP1_9GAST|nr:hypothetical protein RRG08_049623 [Elysia crispata]
MEVSSKLTLAVDTRYGCHFLYLAWILLISLGTRTCTGQFAPTTSPLCQDLGPVCHARAQAEGAKVADAEGELYDCTYRVTAVNCTEEYLCTCGYEVSRYQVQALDEYYDEYLSLCRQVQGHTLRSDDGLSCRDRLEIIDTPNFVQENSLSRQPEMTVDFL